MKEGEGKGKGEMDNKGEEVECVGERN